LEKQFLKYAGIGLLLVLIGIAAIFYVQRGAHIELQGSMLKVRTLPIDAASSAVVIDFRFLNPANYPFIVRKVDVYLEDEQGTDVEGTSVADADVKRLFDYYPILGQKFNPSLLIRTKVAAHQAMDRMIAARFELPHRDLDARKRFKIRIEDVDGAISEIVEARSERR